MGGRVPGSLQLLSYKHGKTTQASCVGLGSQPCRLLQHGMCVGRRLPNVSRFWSGFWCSMRKGIVIRRKCVSAESVLCRKASATRQRQRGTLCTRASAATGLAPSKFHVGSVASISRCARKSFHLAALATRKRVGQAAGVVKWGPGVGASIHLAPRNPSTRVCRQSPLPSCLARSRCTRSALQARQEVAKTAKLRAQLLTSSAGGACYRQQGALKMFDC